MKRVLVAGATGYLGRFVVQALKERGYFVRALVRNAGTVESADEIVVGEVTKPETLSEVCAGIDVLFSSVGITRQNEGLTWRDVDYRGNRNLLEAALQAGVKKLVYVSAFNGRKLRHLDIIDAHEAFVDELMRAGIDYAVLRPTGYFSDLEEVLRMARKGRVWLIGDGRRRVNPIHGADLAAACVDAIEGRETDIDVGGPETMTWREIAAVAFSVLGKPVRITSVPIWLMRLTVRVVRFFNRHEGELLAFFTTMATNEVVAPASGTQTLETFYRREE